jgi:hypothetical protein
MMVRDSAEGWSFECYRRHYETRAIITGDNLIPLLADTKYMIVFYRPLQRVNTTPDPF